METHSSMLAWEIPWTEEPCGLQSMGSQSFRHDLSDRAHTQTHTRSVTYLYASKKVWKNKEQDINYFSLDGSSMVNNSTLPSDFSTFSTVSTHVHCITKVFSK